jgi:HD-GYP domain-containing protein (c-di-GMP phosphodiesterase class II)
MDSLLGPAAPSAAEQPPGREGAEHPEDLYYQLAQQEVARILEATGRGEACTVGTLRRVVDGMVQSLATGDGLLAQAQEAAGAHLDLARHMVNVAIYALKIGQGMGCRDEELPWLGLAACLHDVGMVIVPRPILDKPEALSPDEMALVRQHPENGFRILRTLGPEFEWLANVSLQEHEREDGSGYPRGLSGDQIHEYAKIVGLADVYEALSHHRPYRRRSSPVDVVKELISGERRRFPDRIFKGFIRGLSAFPVGSLVRLNSMEVGRVVATNPALPLRPVVEVMQGPKGERLSPYRRLDLATNTLLYITGSYAGIVAA